MIFFMKIVFLTAILNFVVFLKLLLLILLQKIENANFTKITSFKIDIRNTIFIKKFVFRRFLLSVSGFFIVSFSFFYFGFQSRFHPGFEANLTDLFSSFEILDDPKSLSNLQTKMNNVKE